jgi:hypothetical protein
VAVNRLEERLTRADQLARPQREGLLEVRTATARKRDLRRLMKRAQLAHLARVAKVASREVPEVAERFLLKPGTNTYLAFHTAARAIADEARNQQELLAKYGLVEPRSRAWFSHSSSSTRPWNRARSGGHMSGECPAPGGGR